MRKVCIIHMIGLWVPALLAAQSALGDAGEDLKQAEGLCKAGKYAQAEQVCRRVLQNEPNNPETVYQAGKMLPQVYLAAGQLPQAKEAVKDLLARSAKHEYLPHALHEMIEQAKPIGKTAQAGQICRDLLNSGVQPSQVIWLKMGIALADVYGGNDQAVDAEARDIISANAADPGAAEALAQIGWAYVKLGQDKKARPLYEYVVENWAGKPRAMYAHTALVRSCIRLSDKEAAAAQVQNLVKQYPENVELPKVLNEIARGYREARMYDEARNVSQYVLANYPGHEQRIWADRDLILCDVVQRNLDTAQTGLRKLVEDHADHGYLPYVLREIAGEYLQGRMYEQARSVSLHILDNHSESDQCLWAQRDRVLCDLALKDLEAAQRGTESLLKRSAGRMDALWAVSEVAETYGRIGQHERARELFRFNLTGNPNLDDTIWSLRGFIRESIALKDEAAIDAGVKKLLGEYAGSKNLPMAAVHVGRELAAAGYIRAGDLFQYVIDRHPDDEQALLARVCMGHIYLLQDEYSQADALYQQILVNYAQARNLAEVIQVMAEGYLDRALELAKREPHAKMSEHSQACMRKAIEKWNLILDQMPDTPLVASTACYRLARAHYALGEFQAAIHYGKLLIDRWPDHGGIRDIHLIAYKAYKGLLREGTIEASEAVSATKYARGMFESLPASRRPWEPQMPMVEQPGQGIGGAK